MPIEYCANDPCETEATYLVRHDNGRTTPLCFTCAEAYSWGQAHPDARIERASEPQKETRDEQAAQMVEK